MSKITLNDAQIASLTALLALLPFGSVIAPVYGVVTHLKREESDIDPKIAGYGLQSIGKISLVSLLWVASASHAYLLLIGILAGIAASNVSNTGALPVEEYTAVRDSLTATMNSIQEIDLPNISSKAKDKYTSLREFVEAYISKLKQMTQKSQTAAPAMEKPEVLESFDPENNKDKDTEIEAATEVVVSPTEHPQESYETPDIEKPMPKMVIELNK
jgi:hypothetical protein